VVIHDVDVNQVGASDAFEVALKVDEVRRQDAWVDSDAHDETLMLKAANSS
jgi:hypothetical protein